MSKKFERLCGRYGAYFRVAISSAMSSLALLESDDSSEIATFISGIDNFEMVLIPSSKTENVMLGVAFIMNDGERILSASENGFQAYIDENFFPVTTDLDVDPKTREGAILHIIEVLSNHLEANFYIFSFKDFADFIIAKFGEFCRIENLEDYLVVSFPQIFGQNPSCEIVFMLDEAHSIASFTRAAVDSELENSIMDKLYYCTEFDASAGLTTFTMPDEIFTKNPDYYKFAKKFSEMIFGDYRKYLAGD